jgi:hypothetical protein
VVATVRERVFNKEAVVSSTAPIAVRSVKVMIGVPPDAVLTIAAPNGQARVKFSVTCDGNTLQADVSTKSLRKVQKAITDNG